MAMEFLEGQELKDIIASGKLLPRRPGGGHHLAGRRRAVVRAPAEHRAPRREALEHHGDEGRHREDHRLRHRAPAQLRGEDDDGPHPRQPALHVARAGDRQDHRRAQRHLLARRGALRGAHRRGALRRRQRERDHVRDGEHHAAAALARTTAPCPRCSTSSWPRRWPRRSTTATSRSRSSPTTCARCAARWTAARPAAALKADRIAPRAAPRPPIARKAGGHRDDAHGADAKVATSTEAQRRHGRAAAARQDLRFVRRDAAPRGDDRTRPRISATTSR